MFYFYLKQPDRYYANRTDNCSGAVLKRSNRDHRLAYRSVMCRVTNQIIDTIGKAYRIDDHDIVIGMSAGTGLYPNDGTDAKTLLHHADIAMYEIKEAKKSCAISLPDNYEMSASPSNLAIASKSN